MIDENIFNNNFATEFGTAIAIVKYERDYVLLDCQGIRLFNNLFKNNLGCPYVRGTAIISCMPDKPKLSPLNEVYRGEFGQLWDYMTSYFVSTNDVNSWKGNTHVPTFSRFFPQNLNVEEIDDLTQTIFTKFVPDIALHKGNNMIIVYLKVS